MNLTSLHVILLILTLTLARGAANNDDCDLSACMKQIEWPTGSHGSNGTYGIYDHIGTCANISNNGFFQQDALFVVRFIGPDGRVYKPSEDTYSTLPDVGTSRLECSDWSPLNVGPNGASQAPNGWYNESVQLQLPTGEILDQENKTYAFQIKS